MLVKISSVTRRASMAIHRRLRAARFDEQVTLEGFDFTASPKLPAEVADVEEGVADFRVATLLPPGNRWQSSINSCSQAVLFPPPKAPI
jgi:hypothetical protein